MDYTVTTNFQLMNSYTYISKHVEHDENVNHSNKDIDTHLTYLNESYSYNHERDLLNEKYENFIKEHDENWTRKKHVSKKVKEQNMYHSVDEYRKKKQTNDVVAGVMTIGEMSNWTIEKKKKERDILNATFDKTLKDLFACSKVLMAVKMQTNLDELGGSHAHYELINMSKTKTGKPSTNFNVAVREWLIERGIEPSSGKGANRENLSKMRTECDSTLLDNYNLLGHHNHTLVRKQSELKGMTEEAFKAYKKELEKVENQQSQLNIRNAVLDEEEEKLKLQKEKQDKKEIELKRRENGTNQVENDIADYAESVDMHDVAEVVRNKTYRSQSWADNNKRITLSSVLTRVINRAINSHTLRQKLNNKIQEKQKRDNNKDDGLEL